MSQYAKAVERLNDAATDPALLPCRCCETPTKIETLIAYGARCCECYQAYCREAFEQPTQARLLPAATRSAKPDDTLDPTRIDAAKANALRKAEQYAREHGLDLTAPARRRVAEPQSSMPPEPERFAQEDEA